MSLSPHLRLANDALSHQAKAGVTPIAKLEKRVKSSKGLSRKSQMERGPSKLKQTPLGHASVEQKEKALREGPRLDASTVDVIALGLGFFDLGPVDPAHTIDRTLGGCDDEACTCPLPRRLHDLYDEKKLDLLPVLTLDEQAHAVKHVGILGALKRLTGETYVPERLLQVVSDDGEQG